MSERWYQAEAIQSIYDYYGAGNVGNPIIALPTGTGKSHVISGFIKSVMTTWPNQRFLMLTHVKELIDQNAKKVRAEWPQAPIGIYSAGLNQRDTVMPIIFGGIQSIAKCVELFGWRDLVLVDECHLISPNENTTYQVVLDKLKQINPNVKIIGLTATPYRLGQGYITDEGLFTDICYNKTGVEDFNRFIAEGFLCPLIPKPTKIALDVSGVALNSKGDFAEGALQKCVDKEEITRAAIEEMLKYGHDRHAWLIFSSGIEHAENITKMLKEYGIAADCVHGKRKKKENDQVLIDFKAGKLRCVVNYGKLTTGFDYPAIDLIGMLRATLSPGLWVQMLGRGTRPVFAYGYPVDTIEQRLTAIAASQKQNCMVLDFARNTARLGPINDPHIPKKKGKGGGDAPVRICPECETYNHASARFCILCGTAFEFQTKLVQSAGSTELIKSDLPVIEYYDVNTVTYAKHEKRHPPKDGREGYVSNSLKVSYFCGLFTFNEWIHFEGEKGVLKRARDWWRQRYTPPADWPADQEFIPQTIDLALRYTYELRVPKRIKVHVNKQYPEILSYEY